MTEHEILTYAVCMVDRFLDRHWRIEFRDTLPCPGCQWESKDLAGHTSWDQRLIVLSRRYVLNYPPDRVQQIIEHEIAHALTPEDWVHGDIFHAKLKEIRT